MKNEPAMVRRAAWGLLLTLWLGLAGCSVQQRGVVAISIDYPHGGSRLLVKSSGAAALSYGARPQFQQVENNLFDIDQLYNELQPRLHANRPREEWPDPKAVAGMVVITYENKRQEVYLIFDQQEFAERLFERARAGRVDDQVH